MIFFTDHPFEIGKRYIDTVRDYFGNYHDGVHGVVMREATQEEWLDAVVGAGQLSREEAINGIARHSARYFYDISVD